LRSTIALATAFIIATLFASHPVTSMRELLNFGVQLALLVVATDVFRRDTLAIERIVTLLVVLGAACGVLAVLEATTIIPGDFPRWGTRFYRAALGFGQPNALGLFLAMLIPLAVHELTVARSLAAKTLSAGALGAMCIG